MSGTKLLADTNVIIRVLENHGQAVQLLDGAEVFISVITEMELLSKPGITKSEENLIKSVLNACVIIPLTDMVKDEAIYFRKTYKSKLPDSIVAASASVFSLTPFTFDKAFSKFTDVQIVVLN